MFAGTGSFRDHLCPYLRAATSKGTSLSPTACGRPHCKYHHDVPEIAEEKIQLPPHTSSSVLVGAEIVGDVQRQSSTESRKSITPEKAGKKQSTPEPASQEFDSIPSVINIEATIKTTPQEDESARFSPPPPLGNPNFQPEIVPDKPSYSESESIKQPEADDNPYLVILDDLRKPAQTNDLEYDPVSNWKLPFQSTTESYEPSSTNGHSSEPSGIQAKPIDGPSGVKNRISIDTVVALGKKSVKPETIPLTKAQQMAPLVASQPVPPARSLAASRRSPASSSSDLGKPVRKKARFGKTADEELQVTEQSFEPFKSSKALDPAEVVRNLFGDDDDEDDIIDLEYQPLVETPPKPQIPAKPATTTPKGFPKNPQAVLQSLTVKKEESPVAPKPVPAAPVPPQPKRKQVLTPQQQLELRRKALEEQKKQQQSAAPQPGPSKPSSAAGLVKSASTPVIPSSSDGKRVAHQPSQAVLAPPRVAVIPGSKLNVPFRQQVLERFVQYLKQIHKNENEAIEKALQTEKDIAAMSFHMGTYRNKATHELSRLKQAVAPPAASPTTAPKDQRAVLAKSQSPMQAQKSNFSVIPKAHIQRPILGDPRSWADQDFHAAMRKYSLTEDQLVINGYPLVQQKKQDGENTRNGLQLYIAMSGKITPDRITQTKRFCCRCKKEFFVDYEGNYGRDEECLYHWGKPFSRRVAGEGIASKRTCCSSEDSAGCCVASAHVADTIPSLSGFVSSAGIQPAKPEDRYRVLAIDCEMIYTIGGMEVARVTVVDRNLRCVYESLIRPKQRIVDCNTRFSGLKMDMFSPEKKLKNIEDIHRDLLGNLINEETLLVGHSLESDLLALKLIHRNIVDTSIVFPHKRGAPFKRALKTLMREILQRIIQEDAGGHDSREDAAACMELMVWKIKQDRNSR